MTYVESYLRNTLNIKWIPTFYYRLFILPVGFTILEINLNLKYK